MNQPTTPNGKPISNGQVPQGEIIFPVNYELKAVFDNQFNDSDNKKQLETLFEQLKIKNVFKGNKVSSKGTYISYSYQVTIANKPLLEKLYLHLKQIPGLKTAL